MPSWFSFNLFIQIQRNRKRKREGEKEATFTLEYELNRSMTWSITVGKIGRTKPAFGALFPFHFEMDLWYLITRHLFFHVQ